MDAMLEKQINCPSASSAGRLFDAVAAAVGICFDYIQYEGQAAIELEACITNKAWKNSAQSAYPFKIVQDIVDASPMWNALLEDLSNGISVAHISARFHKGLSNIIQQQANVLARRHNIKTIALSGGVFQNKTLFEDVVDGLQQLNLNVLYHKNIPANDGGLSLGQAVIAAAKIIEEEKCA